MKSKSLLKSIIGIAIAAVLCGYLAHNGTFSCVKQISPLSFVLLLSLSASSFISNGFQMRYLLLRQNNVSLTLWDTILLPFSMNLLSYVIPANGGFLYSVYFFKTKYSVDISKGASIGFFIIYMYLISSGIICMCIGLFMFSVHLCFVGIALILVPWLLWGINKALAKIRIRHSWLKKGKELLSDVVESSGRMMQKSGIVIFNMMIAVMQTLITYLIYWLLAKELTIDISPSTLLTTVLFMQISSFVRILPGNMGIEELFSGGVFILFGQSGTAGVLLSLLLRAARFLLIIPLGLLHLSVERNRANHLLKQDAVDAESTAWDAVEARSSRPRD